MVFAPAVFTSLVHIHEKRHTHALHLWEIVSEQDLHTVSQPDPGGAKISQRARLGSLPPAAPELHHRQPLVLTGVAYLLSPPPA